MSFIDTLRAARESRAAVLHEFLTQYDPHSRRVHAFFEGHDDIVFFVPHIERLLPDGFRLLRYRCEGKPRVMELFAEITRRVPDVRLTLFFVDKDLDDVLGTPWPTDPRIFVTDVYSIENYLVTVTVLTRLYRDSVRLSGVTFDENVITAHFEGQLTRFHRQILSVMAWILVVRRGGGRPNLNNLQMAAMWRVSGSGDLRPNRGRRMEILTQQTGVKLPAGAIGRVREAIRELSRVPPKRIVRGKFEAWFFYEFWKSLVAQLQTAAREGGGKVSIRVPLTENALVAVLAPYVNTPRSLEMFLRAHLLGAQAVPRLVTQPTTPKRRWWQRFLDTLIAR